MSREGVAVVGAGRIGVPWAAVLATDHNRRVTCIDVDPERVAELNKGKAPFKEPNLSDYVSEGVAIGNLSATTDEEAVQNHRYVALTINAPRNGMSDFLDTVREYSRFLEEDQTVIVRSTLPVDMVPRTREAISLAASGTPEFSMFPERLSEGNAIEEIHNLPKIVGVQSESAKRSIEDLLSPFDCPIEFTTPKTAVFVKLIDNSYRDAIFAIANQIAFTADMLGLDSHEAIELANFEYPRNDIPTPGTVGGKCLPKDPHFLTDERVCDQPTTPDLFNSTRRTNASLSSYIVTQILRRQPKKVALLGLSYKRDVGDVYNSPAMNIYQSLSSQGTEVEAHDPHVPEFDAGRVETLREGDVILLAVNHSIFEGIEQDINELTSEDSIVYDVWGYLDPRKLERRYDGFGINSDSA